MTEVSRQLRGRARRKLGCSLLTASLVLAALVLLRILALRSWRAMNEPCFSKVAAIRNGMTEADVIGRLGRPGFAYTSAGAPDDYYVPGYEFRRRRVHGKVLIYLGGIDLIAYIYIDRSGRVEDVFVGGS